MDIFEQQQHEFENRHIGPNEEETKQMLAVIGTDSIDTLISKTIPESIRFKNDLDFPEALSEAAYLRLLKDMSLSNKVMRSFIGQGYYDTHTPGVIQRNVFENPGWYTSYTPYQAEIAQGRLESLLNFQTMVSDLCALPIANASLLDEATAAAEAMSMFFHTLNKGKVTRRKLFVDKEIFPQTLDVLYTRSNPFNIDIIVGDYKSAEITEEYFAAILQYPNNKGNIEDYRNFIDKMHAAGAFVGMATDLLALTLLTPPGELGADAAFGSTQRFGVAMGFGGPHAAFFAIKEDFKRALPGRIIGVSVDAQANKALRMALQTREQHIKREKATSNICTAQALLANMAAMYAVYHGPKGLKNIARRIQYLAHALVLAFKENGYEVVGTSYFDTIVVRCQNKNIVLKRAEEGGMLFRDFPKSDLIGITLDETTEVSDLADIIGIFNNEKETFSFQVEELEIFDGIPQPLIRQSAYLTHPVFNSYHSETQMMRYIHQLESKDLSLNTSMISLGSCTMKLNAASEMIPLSWSHWSRIHPYAPSSCVSGYLTMIHELEHYLCKITGLAACSLQPNSGASGEFAGLLTIRRYLQSIGQEKRNIILIPISAHGTNPASATMAGCKVVVVKALENGNIDVADLTAKAEQYADTLAGIMITYPSTYGIFEGSVKEIIDIVHKNGGQVYMDGANMNAQVGYTSPGEIGADVCHLNLHKTFAIPHGGGGPGVGPICAAEHLKPFLPGHFHKGIKEESTMASEAHHAVSAANYGSASILLISYAYLRLLGRQGIKKATAYAILNANYMKSRLEKDFPILYSGVNGTCAHEFIVDLRPFKKTAGIEAEDVAKRLMDYGFHAPTMSFPVPGTFMVEPTESEDKAELDRFCEAMIAIRNEIREIEEGHVDTHNNVLKNAPHTQSVVISDSYNYPYSREQAAFPLAFVKENKFWPSVARVNNTIGDRNLICTCEPVEAYMEEA